MSAAAGFGQWNGVVTLSTVVKDTSIPGNTTTALEQISFVIHGDRATETGSAKWWHAYSDSCGGQVDSWYWSLGDGASVPVAVTVGDSAIEFRVTKDAQVKYTFVAVGKKSLTEEQGGKGLCEANRTPEEPKLSGTGDPGFDDNVKSDRQYLLRTSGRFAATDAGQTYHASGGTVGSGMTTVTWNLIRTGPDRDHDGLADPGDAHPNNRDADGDGYPDGWEQDNGTSPTNSHSHPHTPYHPGAPDSDHDGWSDYNEINQGTDPNDSHRHPPGRPDSPPVHPLPPVTPPVPPIEQHTDHWVKVPSTITCDDGVILTQRCHGILSPNATKNLNAKVVSYTVPTLAQEREMCTKFVVIPDVKDCIASNLWSFGTQASFKLGLSIAAKAGKCFFFDLSRRKIGNIWSGDWSRDYNQGDFEMDVHETRMFGAVIIRCGEPDSNWISRLG
ncbi:MAG: hypothetical protein H0X39_02225 [Actinobacteria bacterium]|nr:hypothetical protein [Actinomycetota bacterium]